MYCPSAFLIVILGTLFDKRNTLLLIKQITLITKITHDGITYLIISIFIRRILCYHGQILSDSLWKLICSLEE